jgi:hypothetical protein
MTNTSNTLSRRKVGRSIAIEAGKALNKDKTVFLLPVLSFIAHIVVAVIALIAWILAIPFMNTNPNGTNIVDASIGIIVYILFAFINVGTQAAVMTMANETFEGKNPSIASSIGNVFKHARSLSGLAVLEGTVGLILRALQNAAKDNAVLRIVTSIISFIAGMVWAVATYFAIPFIIFNGETTFESIKKSAALIKSKWGAALRVNVAVGAVVFLGMLLSIGGLAGGLIVLLNGTGLDNVAIDQNQIVLGSSLLIASALLLIVLILVNSTLMAYVRVALFRYATDQSLPGFDTSNLDQAFVTSKASKFGFGGSN